jgi:hypothetical protein
MVDTPRPSKAFWGLGSLRADHRLQFLQRSIVQGFDGQMKVLGEQVEESGSLSKGQEQAQRTGRQQVAKGIALTTDLNIGDQWARWGQRFGSYRVFLKSM